MKTSFVRQILFCAAAAIAVACIGNSSLFTSVTHAADSLVSKEQYKVIDTQNVGHEQIENQLNSLAVYGWKVRTALGNDLILAR